MYYFNCIKPPPKIDMKLNPVSSDPVQVNNFLNNDFGINSKIQHKQFKCCFACQDPKKSNPGTQVLSKLEIVPLPEAHLICF